MYVETLVKITLEEILVDRAAALEVTSGLWQNNIACHLTATAPMGEASQRHALYVVLFSNDKVENLIASMVLT